MGRIDSVPNGVSGTFFCLGMRRSQKNCSFLLAQQKSNHDYLVNLVEEVYGIPECERDRDKGRKYITICFRRMQTK